MLVDAHELTDLAIQSPLVTAAVYRLLLAILHRSLRGPRHAAEWRGWWRVGRFPRSTLERYLGGEAANRFDLFDPVFPWYQTGHMQAGYRPVSVLALGHQHTSFGANPQMFGGGVNPDPSIGPAHAALLLLAHQSYALGGTISRLPGEPPSAKGAPLAKAAVVLPKGSNLFQTLMLSLVPYQYREEDRPAWERGGTGTGERAVEGHVDYLTFQARRLSLLPPAIEDGRLVVRHVQRARGWELPDDDTQRLIDPMLAWRKNQKTKDWYNLAATTDRAAWRDLPALLATSAEDQPPRNLTWARELGIDVTTVEAFGMVNSKYKILQWYRRSIVVPAGSLSNSYIWDAIAEAVRLAEAVTRTLTYRLSTAKLTGDLTDHWAELDQAFRRWLAELGSGDSTLEDWRERLRRLTWRSFALRVDGMPVMARARAERQFNGALLATLTEEPKEEKDALR